MIIPEYDCVVAMTESGVIDGESSIFCKDVGVDVSINDDDVVWFDNQTRTLLNFLISFIFARSLTDDSRCAK